jgi:hypothetical protein
MREALYPTPVKDDPCHADLLLELLLMHRNELCRLTADNGITKVEGTAQAGGGEEKTAQLNRLTGYLKVYFRRCWMLERFAKLDSKLVCDLLERWPSLKELQAAPPGEVKKFFRHRQVRHRELNERRMEGNSQANPAIRDQAVNEAKPTVSKLSHNCCARCVQGIAVLDRKIAEVGLSRFFHFRSRCHAALFPILGYSIWLAPALGSREGLLFAGPSFARWARSGNPAGLSKLAVSRSVYR